MPIIKSAKKRVRQDKKRRARNFAVRARLRKAIRAFVDLIKDNKKGEAVKAFDVLQKEVDTAAKKNILHKNNAARKKARYAKMLVEEEKKVAA